VSTKTGQLQAGYPRDDGELHSARSSAVTE